MNETKTDFTNSKTALNKNLQYLPFLIDGVAIGIALSDTVNKYNCICGLLFGHFGISNESLPMM